MTKRKFTPPTEFPAEYVDGEGNKSVVLGRGPNKEVPLIGYDAYGDAASWTETGQYYTDMPIKYDLHDIPKRNTTWHNVYPDITSGSYSSRAAADNRRYSGCICVYRIERDEDGGNPEMFEEEM